PISVFCVITEWNIGYLEHSLDELKRFPLHHVGLLHSNFITEEMAAVHNQLYAHRYPATVSDVEQVTFEAFDLPRLEEELKRIRSGNYPCEVSVHPDIPALQQLTDYYQHPQKRVGTSCMDVFNMLMIKSDGSVIPAHGRCYNRTVGNLYTEELKH